MVIQREGKDVVKLDWAFGKVRNLCRVTFFSSGNVLIPNHYKKQHTTRHIGWTWKNPYVIVLRIVSIRMNVSC